MPCFQTIRYGLPFEPTTLAYDPIQKVLAVGSKSGDIRLYGKPGVETYVCHEEGRAIKHLFFSVNEVREAFFKHKDIFYL